MAFTIVRYFFAILALILSFHSTFGDALSLRAIEHYMPHVRINQLAARDLTVPAPPAGWQSLGCYK
jgi:hypothetical protein